MKKIILTVLAVIPLVGIAPAGATIVHYPISTFVGTGTPQPGPYADVVLDDHGGPNVTVTETMTPGVGLVDTGAGDPLRFTLFGHPVVSITGVTAGFAVGNNGTTTGPGGGGAGTFFYTITCPTGCGNGGNQPHLGPLSFIVNGVSLSAFVANPDGNFFASDICTKVGPNGRCATDGFTGNAVATGPTNGNPGGGPGGNPIPEPALLSLLGLSLLGPVGVRRRKKS